jgi:hypothetical protein
MSRQELAEAVTVYLHATTERSYGLNAHYVARLERGLRRWPNADYRAGFRAVLRVETDEQLGFYNTTWGLALHLALSAHADRGHRAAALDHHSTVARNWDYAAWRAMRAARKTHGSTVPPGS